MPAPTSRRTESLHLIEGERRTVALPARAVAPLRWVVGIEGDCATAEVIAGEGRPDLPPDGLPPSSFTLHDDLVVTGIRVGRGVVTGRLIPGDAEAALLEELRIEITVMGDRR